MTLLAAYNFDEATGAVVDVSGNGHDFTLAGTSVRTTGDGGHTDEGLTQTSTTTDAGPALFGQTAARTLMFWLRSTADFTGWVFEWHDNDLDTGFWGLLCLSGQMGFRGRNAGGSTAFASRARPTDNAWHHWAGTYDGSAVRTYYDGVLQGSPVTLSGGIAATAEVIRTFTSAGNGTTIDDVRVYDEVLDQATIASLMGTPVGAGPAPVDEITASLPIELGIGGVLDAPAATVGQLSATLPAEVGLGGTLTAPAATVGELSGSVPVAVDLAGVLDAPTATVPALSAALAAELDLGGVLEQPTSGVPTAAGILPLVVELRGVLAAPTATVSDLTGTLPLELGLGGTLTAPAPPVPALTAALPLVLSVAGVLDAPAASVPDLAGLLAVRVTIGGLLSNGSEHDVNLSATLGPQDSPTGTLGPRRWTATLGSQP